MPYDGGLTFGASLCVPAAVVRWLRDQAGAKAAEMIQLIGQHQGRLSQMLKNTGSGWQDSCEGNNVVIRGIIRYPDQSAFVWALPLRVWAMPAFSTSSELCVMVCTSQKQTCGWCGTRVGGSGEVRQLVSRVSYQFREKLYKRPSALRKNTETVWDHKLRMNKALSRSYY